MSSQTPVASLINASLSGTYDSAINRTFLGPYDLGPTLGAFVFVNTPGGTLACFGSADGGATWVEQDVANEPALNTSYPAYSASAWPDNQSLLLVANYGPSNPPDNVLISSFNVTGLGTGTWGGVRDTIDVTGIDTGGSLWLYLCCLAGGTAFLSIPGNVFNAAYYDGSSWGAWAFSDIYGVNAPLGVIASENGQTVHAPCAASFAGSGYAIFTGTGLNDATGGGGYTGTSQIDKYVITISATAPDSFTWTLNGGPPSSPVLITTLAQSLSNGVTITFANLLGHTIGDSWTIYGYPQGMYDSIWTAGVETVALLSLGAIPFQLTYSTQTTYSLGGYIGTVTCCLGKVFAIAPKYPSDTVVMCWPDISDPVPAQVITTTIPNATINSTASFIMPAFDGSMLRLYFRDLNTPNNTDVATTKDGINWTLDSTSANWPGTVLFPQSASPVNYFLKPSGLVGSVASWPGGSVNAWYFLNATCAAPTPPSSCQFVAVGSDGTQSASTALVIATSSDGITWTPRTSPESNWLRVAYGAGKFVTIDNSNASYNSVGVSGNGATWTGNGGLNGYSNFDIAYGAGLFVVSSPDAGPSGGLYQSVYTSPDGVTWTWRDGPQLNTSPPCGPSNIVFAGGQFVIASQKTLPSGSVNVIWTSPDGITWTAQTSPLDSVNGIYSISALAWGRGLYMFSLADASAPTWDIMTSPDGVTWTLYQPAELSNKFLYGLTFGAGVFVACGNDVSTGNSEIYVSLDGASWQIPYSVASPTRTFGAVTYGAGVFVAVSFTASMTDNQVLRSTDGFTWALQSMPHSVDNFIWHAVVNNCTGPCNPSSGGRGGPSVFIYGQNKILG